MQPVTIFGYAVATALPQLFFSNLPPTQALVFSYLTLGAGYPARLLGAFIFGHFGDRAGRKSAFLINILIVGGSTCLTGLSPGHAKLGIVAPVLLVRSRIIQGIGVGGEFGGATSLLAEFEAKRRSRAFWMSLANLGIALGVMAASAVFLLQNPHLRSHITFGKNQQRSGTGRGDYIHRPMECNFFGSRWNQLHRPGTDDTMQKAGSGEVSQTSSNAFLARETKS